VSFASHSIQVLNITAQSPPFTSCFEMKILPATHFYSQPADDHDKAALKAAIEFGIDKAKELSLDRVIILIATKQHTGHIEGTYGKEGEAVVKRWLLGEKQSNGITVKIESKGTYSSIKKDLAVCVSFDTKDLFAVENESSVNAIIAVPFIQEIDEWTKVWEAYEIRSAQKALPYPPLSCAVQKGLDNLHAITYGGTDNSSDQYKMKTLARVLKKYEPATIPQAVGAYLLYTHRWKASYALYVQELLQKLQDGKTFQGGDKTGLDKIYKRWQLLCK
jgi:hypothetical protein